MPTRIENILLRARDTLADPNAARYSNERLLRLLSEGQKDIVNQTKLLRNSYELLAIPDLAVYTLPEDVWIITRASYKGSKLSLVTFDKMDDYLTSTLPNYVENNNSWEDTVGVTPLALVYDRLNIQKLRIYPILSEDLLDNSYTFTGGNLSFYGGFEFGVVTDITNYFFNSVFGIITDFKDPFVNSSFSSYFGVTTKLSEVDSAITVQYFAIAPEVTSVNDELIISPLLDTALKHYVVSQAYIDDVDTQSQQLAATAFKFYERELVLGKATGANNSTKNVDRSSEYKGPF